MARASATATEELVAVDNSASPAIWTNGARFNGARYNGARFNGSRFNGARYNGARFNGARFNGARFNGSRYNGARFNGADSTALVQRRRYNGARFNGSSLNGPVVADNGFTRVSGLDLSNGVQSDPYLGTIDLRNDARLDGITGLFLRSEGQLAR